MSEETPPENLRPEPTAGIPGGCATHPSVPAHYQCDGCGAMLCDECIEESYRLLLCRLCGERALPLAVETPATVKERRLDERKRQAAAYGMRDALLYPFRGSGPYMFIATLVSLGVATFVRDWGMSCLGLVFYLLFFVLVIGIQFKIVETTAGWEDELPDWPEYYSAGERVVEILTWLVLAGLQWGPAVAFLVLFSRADLLVRPSLVFWLLFAAALWLGTALSVMGWGAAGVHWRHLSLRLDLHVRGLTTSGSDALQITNVTFVLFGAILVARGLLSQVPVVGAVLSGTLYVYWAFVAPHLVGLLFRRHADALNAIYAD
jgi:hypothetical protein